MATQAKWDQDTQKPKRNYDVYLSTAIYLYSNKGALFFLAILFLCYSAYKFGVTKETVCDGRRDTSLKGYKFLGAKEA